jgi:RimJ/RimL family protein N-acetyltransferase
MVQPPLWMKILPHTLRDKFCQAAFEKDRRNIISEYNCFRSIPELSRLFFAVFKKSGEDQPAFAGMSELEIIRDEDGNIHDARLCGSYILKKFRGLHLGDYLYRARLSYISQSSDIDAVYTEIRTDNIASQKTAERNGFHFYKQESFGMGDHFRTYCLDVDSLRNKAGDFDLSAPLP